MSDTSVDARARPRRSVLAVPGSSPRMLAKAATLPADEVFLDLEDAVADPAKAEARENVVRAIAEGDWGDRLLAVRINAMRSPWYRDDLDAVLSRAARRLDAVIVPKVETAEQVRDLAGVMTAAGSGAALEVQIETALGLMNVEAIAAGSDRLAALHFGPADMSASLGMPALTAGGLAADYPGDQWHAVLVRILVAARANGLQALDGPHLALGDPDGLRAAALRVRVLGYDGKWAIHPAQLEVINEAFSPTEEEVERAREILAALEAASTAGVGAVRHGGEMLDEANRRMAERVLARAGAAR